MRRICKMTAVAALTISTAAQAGPNDALATRIHDAAVTACAVETIPNASRTSLYGAIKDTCVYRLSRSAMTRYENLAKTGAPAKLANK
jgi:hypothetical protein